MIRTLLVAVVFALPATAADPAKVDVVVYGGTPGGVAAAVAAGKAGCTVVLVEPYSWVGGLTTNGLSHPDFRTFEALTGAYLDFTRRVLAYYTKEYGADSAQVKDSRHGTHAEPHVNRLIFEQMLAEQKSVAVHTRWQLKSVDTQARRVTAATFADEAGVDHRVEASVFIDASYEGDLAAAAGVKFRVGREGRAEYGEPLAPEQPDGQVQGYNFRLSMTNDPENMAEVVAPEGYDREDFVGVLPLFEDGPIKAVYGMSNACFKLQIPVIPNGKRDINDVSHSAVRLSLPKVSPRWPNGTPKDRAGLFAEHVRHNVGLLYFLRTDPEVPEKVRAEANQWAWCKDEFVTNKHLPEQLYVREARRMVGRDVFTETKTAYAKDDARGLFQPDAVAMGDYGPNCHGTSHAGPRIGGKHTGEFYKSVPPYQIPYGVILPAEFDNLLVPVACSASHVGFCALRLEPIWSSLGQAAGVAAGIAVRDGTNVPDVKPAAIRVVLHAAGAATAYVSDVPPGSPDFRAVQWWASLGGLHGLHPAPAEPGQRGKNIVGQYYEAYPGHTMELDKPLDAATRKRWVGLTADADLASGGVADAATRGEFIRAAFSAATK